MPNNLIALNYVSKPGLYKIVSGPYKPNESGYILAIRSSKLTCSWLIIDIDKGRVCWSHDEDGGDSIHTLGFDATYVELISPMGD